MMPSHKPGPSRTTELFRFYEDLLAAYGPQGWWPLLDHDGVNPTKTGSIAGYHPGDYSFPRNGAQRFEICVGAILTQNTAWPNVEKALSALKVSGNLEPGRLLDLEAEALAALIRPSGYHNAKSRKLKELASFFLELGGAVPTRESLLGVWGVGPETADSIRLYAYGQPEMVVDAYTRRVFERIGWVAPPGRYEDLKAYCVENLPKDLVLYQEFHALVVEHAKRLKRAAAQDWRRPVKD